MPSKALRDFVPTYADIIAVYSATDCPEAHEVADTWLKQLALAADASRLRANAERHVNRRCDTVRVMCDVGVCIKGV